jgi:hypothetical protein
MRSWGRLLDDPAWRSLLLRIGLLVGDESQLPAADTASLAHAEQRDGLSRSVPDAVLALSSRLRWRQRRRHYKASASAQRTVSETHVAGQLLGHVVVQRDHHQIGGCLLAMPDNSPWNPEAGFRACRLSDRRLHDGYRE